MLIVTYASYMAGRCNTQDICKGTVSHEYCQILKWPERTPFDIAYSLN